jgi:hypothetical protein
VFVSAMAGIAPEGSGARSLLLSDNSAPAHMLVAVRTQFY